MFGRRTAPDTDAGAIARRRLAALAAQFEAITSGAGVAPSTAAQGGAVASSAGPAQTTSLDAGAADHDSDELERPLHEADGSVAHPAAGPASGGGRHAARRRADEYGRWNLTAHQVAVVALIVAAVVAVAAWWVMRSLPQPAPVQLASERTLPSTASTAPLSPSVPPVATPTGGALATPADVADTAAPVVVDVAGKVRRPGIVELPAGSRVVDALRAAGGARPGVTTTSLNLARLLVDGEQIVVGLKVPAVDLAPSPAPTGGSTTGAITSVDLNTATQEQLETLPGIGPVTAASILAWRSDNGAFSSVDELLEVSGIGEVTLADIEAYVYV